MEKVRTYLQKCETAKTSDIAQMLGLSVSRTRALLFEMEDVEALGVNRTRTYRLQLKQNKVNWRNFGRTCFYTVCESY